jgi:ketosteroid isomerase-like protein
MPDQTASSVEQQARRVFELLDAMDLNSISELLADDAQGIDEISQKWMRGRQTLSDYFDQLKGTVSDVRSRLSDLNAVEWGDVGVVTCLLNQTYTMDGQEENVSAPTSMVFRRDGETWKIALIHTVPFPE